MPYDRGFTISRKGTPALTLTASSAVQRGAVQDKKLTGVHHAALLSPLLAAR
ncbi:MAG: hypothetical protein ACKV19_16160 [Verrucomicrobiales bacterium]